MSTPKNLIRVGFAALSLGAGVAMAQESGYTVGPYEEQQAQRLLRVNQTPAAIRSGAVAPSVRVPQFGSSDQTVVNNWPVLESSDGNGP